MVLILTLAVLPPVWLSGETATMPCTQTTMRMTTTMATMATMMMLVAFTALGSGPSECVRAASSAQAPAHLQQQQRVVLLQQDQDRLLTWTVPSLPYAPHLHLHLVVEVEQRGAVALLLAMAMAAAAAVAVFLAV